jgi:hypothetical protein
MVYNNQALMITTEMLQFEDIQSADNQCMYGFYLQFLRWNLQLLNIQILLTYDFL